MILGLSIFGALLSLFAAGCVQNFLTNQEDGKLFGKIDWYIIGIVGYVLMGATCTIPAATKVLATITAIATCWLIYKAVKIRLTCPFCPMSWAVNAVIVVYAFAFM